MMFSAETFDWMVSAVIFSTSAGWFAVDAVRLARALPYSKDTHDRVFGSVIGMVMCAFGMAGVIKHLVG